MLLGKPERLGKGNHPDRLALRPDQAEFWKRDFAIQTMGAFFRCITALERSDGSNLSIHQNNVLPDQ
ncbi:MAG: hypothetical protein WCA24_01685 [Thiomonas sp.]